MPHEFLDELQLQRYLRALGVSRRGGYHHFRNEIASMMPPTQSPKYTIVGHRERAFERQRPFSVLLPRAAAAA